MDGRTPGKECIHYPSYLFFKNIVIHSDNIVFQTRIYSGGKQNERFTDG